jgi:hypothetical protein
MKLGERQIALGFEFGQGAFFDIGPKEVADGRRKAKQRFGKGCDRILGHIGHPINAGRIVEAPAALRLP